MKYLTGVVWLNKMVIRKEYKFCELLATLFETEFFIDKCLLEEIQFSEMGYSM